MAAANRLMEGQPDSHVFLVCELNELDKGAEFLSIIVGGDMPGILRMLSATLNVLKQDAQFQAAYLELLDQAGVSDEAKAMAQFLIDKIAAK